MKTVVVVEEFKSYLKQIGYSKTTCSMLPDCVEDFLCYTGKDPETITQADIQTYHQWLQIRPHKRTEGALSEQYINHHLYSLKTFFNWLEATGEILTNPISAMKFKTPQIKERQPLSKTEIITLFAACKNLKETAVLHLFYSCGLRRSEAEALNTEDIRFTERVLYVRKGKGARRRAIPLTKAVSQELEAYYLSEREQNKESSFMLSSIGTRMSGEGYSRVLKKILSRSGIERAASLHHLRHSIATHLLESGLPVEQVREFLGHRHLESTQIYAKVNQKQLESLC